MTSRSARTAWAARWTAWGCSRSARAAASRSRSRRTASPPRRRRLAAPVLAAALAGAACSGGWERIPAAGEVAGQRVETTVDSELARHYLEDYDPRAPQDGPLDGRLRALLEPLPRDLPDGSHFAQLAEETSVDLATLHLVDIVAAMPANARLARVFEDRLERVRALSPGGHGELRACAQELGLPPVWFAPGWFWETSPGTGADFHRQRGLLDRLGVPSRLLRVIENGIVEENARLIAAAIRGLGPEDRIILVSASKGGPEVAHALGHLLTPEETRPVVAWINVGGLLRGSPLADFATTWPTSWLSSLYTRLVERRDPGDSIASLRTDRSAARLARQEIPGHVMVINLAGVPLSGHIGAASEFGYTRIRPQGPNDGLTLITDELAHGGRTIVQVGLDHYYRDPELDLKTVALALTVVTELGQVLPGSCRPAGAAGPGLAPGRAAGLSGSTDHRPGSRASAFPGHEGEEAMTIGPVEASLTSP